MQKKKKKCTPFQKKSSWTIPLPLPLHHIERQEQVKKRFFKKTYFDNRQKNQPNYFTESKRATKCEAFKNVSKSMSRKPTQLIVVVALLLFR